jgi:archaellum component FlaC
MWREIYDYGKQLLSLARTTEQNQEDIEELRQEIKELTAVVQRLAFEFQRLSENEKHERDKMMLQLENHLLRSERGLPPGRQNLE